MTNHRKGLIGSSSAFLEMMESVSRYARHHRPVLVIGERGTGKEEIASRLHYLSPRWQQNLVKLNCAAFNDELLDSELFGHEAGAFTGARQSRAGLFEEADGGTLFLDELATMGPRLQDKLLRVTEYGEFYRVGSSRVIKVDVRVIAATNENLPELAAAGKFRQDLLDRLAFDVIAIPPLRVRQDDILQLAHHFALRMQHELADEMSDAEFNGFSETAIETLIHHHWPGNVRELKNAVERSVCHAGSDGYIERIILNPFDSPWLKSLEQRVETEPAQPAANNEKTPDLGVLESSLEQLTEGCSINLKQIQIDVEKALLNRALEASQFKQRKAAEKLGLTYDQLRSLIRKYPQTEAES
ncbi:phage shock protein operon transcriptional activator [Spongorhabdus nitratireducens]